MKFILSTFVFVFILANAYGQNHLHVTNNDGGEIAKLESKSGFPQLVIANDHGDIAQIGLKETENDSVPTNDDLLLRTLTAYGKILLRVGGENTGKGIITINPNNDEDDAFTGAYVGINAGSPSAPLTVANVPGGVTAEFRAGANAQETYVQFTGNSGSTQKGYMGFFDPGPDDFKIGTYGGSPSLNPTGKLIFQTQNMDRMWIEPGGDVKVCGNLEAAGSLLGNQISACSDIRYKMDIINLSNSLDNIKSLQGVNYHWNKEKFPDKNFNAKKQIGLIAQDVERTLPELVVTDQEGYKSVDYVSLTAVLVEAIKELDEKVERIAELENKLMALVSNE